MNAAIDDAYQACARLVLETLNPAVHYGYWSVCSDRKGHGERNTYPGLDFGQIAEALLWLGRAEEVRANWDYVRQFQRDDGLCPFAIFPEFRETTVIDAGGYPLTVHAGGAIYEHWVPGNPLRILANTTLLNVAAALYRHTRDLQWLTGEAAYLKRIAGWLAAQVDASGLLNSPGFYLERPLRAEYDGVAQCCGVEALRRAAGLFDLVGDRESAERCREAAATVARSFQERFWQGDRFAEYLNHQHGAITLHGYTDTDWAALAVPGMAGEEQIATLWPRLRAEPDFLYGGMPTGIATRPELYQPWEVQEIDYHDVAAMGRVWYLEAQARFHRGDREGLLDGLRRVAERGRRDNWVFMERYYSERTGDRSIYQVPTYCEYPANFIRIRNEFVK